MPHVWQGNSRHKPSQFTSMALLIPTDPLEVFRDAAIQVIEAAGNLIDGFLDVLADVIEKFKELINAEIHVPIISALFELISGGDPLTALNLASLVLAIPTTVISKIAFGEAPFKDTALPDLSSIGSARSGLTASKVMTITDDVNAEGNKVWLAVSLACDIVGGLITAGLDAIPMKNDGDGNFQPDTSQSLNLLSAPEILSLCADVGSWIASIPGSSMSTWIALSFRGAMNLMDVGYMVISYTEGQTILTRMKRGNVPAMALYGLFAFCDLYFTCWGWKNPDDELDASEHIGNTAHVIGAVSNMAGILRRYPPYGNIALVSLDVISMVLSVVSTSMQIHEINHPGKSQGGRSTLVKEGLKIR